jgi:hypothetical protein
MTRKEMAEEYKLEVKKSMDTLIRVRDTSPSALLAMQAANAILDRLQGKPHASVSVEHVEDDKAAERRYWRDLVRRRPELAEVARELQSGNVVEGEVVSSSVVSVTSASAPEADTARDST